MKDDNEKQLDYDERIRLHNEIMNNTNESVYKNINSINPVNDESKKIEENKNTEVNNNESDGGIKFILKFIIALSEVTLALVLCAAVLAALAFGICTLIFSGI